MDVIRYEAVSLRKKEQDILRNVSFCVQAGECIGIAGPSGSGKTSLLRILNLLHSPTSGTVTYKGQDILGCNPVRLRREIGYVLQKPYLFEGTVRDNLEYPYLVWKQHPDSAEIESYLEKVNLPPSILDKRGGELSGGEAQRAALVRSLLAKPEVLLLDEMSSALDEDNTLVMEQLIGQERQSRNLTVLFISHNSGQLSRLAGQVLHLENGSLSFAGPAEDFFRKRGGAGNE